MAAIPYLTSEQLPTSVELNELVAELDRKTGIALDLHALPYLLSEGQGDTLAAFRPFMGPVYLFVTSQQRISGYWGSVSYDHTAYTAAVAAAVVSTGPKPTIDPLLRGIRVNPFPAAAWAPAGRTWGTGPQDNILLCTSLEAHVLAHGPQGEKFWIIEQGSEGTEHAQRIRAWDQAEIIIEGPTGLVLPGGQDFDIPPEWNKFNFFRIHNLNRNQLRVNFKKANGATAAVLTVDPYSSKCIRRTAVEGVYTEGYRYFQKFLPTDPRFYQHETANFVCSPSRIIPFVNTLLAGKGASWAPGYQVRPTVFLDPHVRAPLLAESSALYGDPDDEDTLVGDLLHHKGQFLKVTHAGGAAVQVSTVQFNGYATLQADLEAAGLTLARNGDELEISAGGITDLVSLSTNLFCTPCGQFIAHPVVTVTPTLTLPRTVPARSITPLNAPVSETHIQFYAADGSLQTVTRRTRTAEYITSVDPNRSSNLVINRHTVGEAGTLEHVGVVGYGDQDTDAGVFVDRSMALGTEGCFINATQRVYLRFSIAGVNAIQLGECELGGDVAGEAWLDYPRAVLLSDYGWPNTDAWLYTGFFPPHTARTYTDRPTSGGYAQGHPDFSTSNPDGRDARYLQDRGKLLSSSIAVLSPWNSRNSYYLTGGALNVADPDFPYLDLFAMPGTASNNDVLYGVTKNVQKPGWWNSAVGGSLFPGWTNRARALANRIFYGVASDGSDASFFPGFPDAARMYRFMRMPFLAEHFNNLAAKVNSMKRARPLNWIDHGCLRLGSDNTQRYRARPNQTGIYELVEQTDWFNTAGGQQLTQERKELWQADYRQLRQQWPQLRPVTQYAMVRTAAEREVFEALGVPIRTIADLPDGFAAKKSAKSRTAIVTVHYTARIAGDVVGAYSGTRRNIWPHTLTLADMAATATTAYEETNSLLREDLNAVTAYDWVQIADVKAAAEELGYKFIPSLDMMLGRAVSLIQDEADGFSVITPQDAIVRVDDPGPLGAPSITGFSNLPYADHTISADYTPLQLDRPLTHNRQPDPNNVLGPFNSRVLEFVDTAAPTWICAGTEHLLQPDSADAVLVASGSVAAGQVREVFYSPDVPPFSYDVFPPPLVPLPLVLKANFSRAFRAVNYTEATFARNPAGRRAALPGLQTAGTVVPAITTAIVSPNIVVLDPCSAGVSRKCRLAALRVDRFQTEDEFASTYDRAIARLANNELALPVTVTPAAMFPKPIVLDPIEAGDMAVYSATTSLETATRPVLLEDHTVAL